VTTTAQERLIAAYFQNYADAENAMRDLQKAGFRSDQIGSSYEDYESTSTGVGSAAAETTDHRSFWDKVRDFFSGEPEHHPGQTQDTGSSGSWAIPDRYRDQLNHGGGLITVRTGDRFNEAEAILTRNHGQIDRDFASAWESNAAAETGQRRIQLLSEVLRVHKERVSHGEVRLRKEVHTETQNVQVPVTHEEVVIERTQGGQTPASRQVGADQEIRIPLSEERVQVEKVPVVREEVNVRKRPVSDTQNVSDEVRREELKVEGQDEKIRSSEDKRKRA
jgi:uncharacterized protein (TIGR02271 family)